MKKQKFNGQVVLEWILISSLAVLVLGSVVYGVARGANTTGKRANTVMGGMGRMGEGGYSPYDTLVPSETSVVTTTVTLTPTETFQATGIYVDPILFPGLTDTVTPFPSPTETWTITPTFTATSTRTPTFTPTDTFTPTFTDTLTPTDTLTLTPTFSATDTPVVPTATSLPDPVVVAYAGPYSNSSQSFTIPASANLVVVLEAGPDHTGPSAMSLGGVPMTRYAYTTGSASEFWSYYIVTSAKGLSGTQTLSITRNYAGSNYAYEIYAIANATASSPFRDYRVVTAAPGLQSLYTTMSTQPGDLILAAAGISTTGTFTHPCFGGVVGLWPFYVTGYTSATSTATSVCWIVSWDTTGQGVFGALIVRT
jgi:Predicted solute binding protein